ncbi:NAD(P)-dependent oxidoreductase [Azospirillum formosense]|uniref:NAD-dependent epimerase/dehydratase family protein n=1 Tax=Azospirillum formosense TaxID=861533 RepID=UPI00338F13CC
MSRTVIVVGASGFVGRHLVDALVARGHRAIGVNRSGAPVPGCERTVAFDRLSDLPSLPGDTALFHVAAYRYDAQAFQTAQSDILAVNSALANRVYAFCVERGIREVRLASSSAVYPANVPVMDDSQPVDLNAPPHAGEAFYAWSKRWSETVARLHAERFGISTVAFRLSNPYGAYDATELSAAHVAPAFVIKVLSDSPTFEVLGNPAAVERDFIYAGDVAEVFVRSLDWSGRSDAFNLCTGATVSLLTLAETVLAVAGVDKPIVSTGGNAGAGVSVRRLTGERLREAFGVVPTPLADGLKPTIDWYRHALARNAHAG